MWVDFCLFEGKVRVVIDGWSSDQLSINAGVPQGLVSSATLFLLHINALLNPVLLGTLTIEPLQKTINPMPERVLARPLEKRWFNDCITAWLYSLRVGRCQSCLFQRHQKSRHLFSLQQGVLFSLFLLYGMFIYQSLTISSSCGQSLHPA